MQPVTFRFLSSDLVSNQVVWDAAPESAGGGNRAPPMRDACVLPKACIPATSFDSSLQTLLPVSRGGLHLSICGHLVRPRTFLPAQRSESKRHFLRRFFHFRACYMDDVSEPTPVNEKSTPKLVCAKVLLATVLYCCSTTWSPSFNPFTISVWEPFDRPTATAILRVPSF